MTNPKKLYEEVRSAPVTFSGIGYVNSAVYSNITGVNAKTKLDPKTVEKESCMKLKNKSKLFEISNGLY